MAQFCVCLQGPSPLASRSHPGVSLKTVQPGNARGSDVSVEDKRVPGPGHENSSDGGDANGDLESNG